MIPKKSLLFSASLLLMLAASTAYAQEASQATPPAQAPEASLAFSLFTSGGNYIGITTTEVTRENMGRYNMREPRGVAITRVSEGSPAQRAGLMAGDVILRFDNEQVTTYNKLQRLINEAAPEQTVRLGISRNGAEQEVSVTLGRRQDAFQDLSRVYGAQQQQAQQDAQRTLEQLRRSQGGIGFGGGRRIGVTTTQLTKQLADYFGITGGKGVLVTNVAENSPAARAGLKAGDVIVDVDGERIESSGDLSRVINKRQEGDITLTIVRDRNQRNLRVTPEKRTFGAISPEMLEIEPGSVEILTPTIDIMPNIDIRLPQIKVPITIPRVAIPKVKIKPEQLRQLQKLEELNLL